MHSKFAKYRIVIAVVFLVGVSCSGYYLLRAGVGLRLRTSNDVPAPQEVTLLDTPTPTPEVAPVETAPPTIRAQIVTAWYKTYFAFPVAKRPEQGTKDIPFKMSTSLLALGATAQERCKKRGLVGRCGWNATDSNFFLGIPNHFTGEQLTFENTGFLAKDIPGDTVEVTLNSYGEVGGDDGLRTIRYNMIEEDGEWRVDDIEFYESLKLRDVLKQDRPAEWQKLELNDEMTFQQVKDTLAKKGYVINLDTDGSPHDSDLPAGMSCGQGYDAVCSAEFKKPSGDEEVSLVFASGSRGWILDGGY